MTSGLRIVEVRIRNFRSLRQVDVRLDAQTVLLGANNSGKTAFLEAVHAAIGAGQRTVSSQDIYLGPNETSPPKDRVLLVDVLVRPTDAAGGTADTFEEGSPWLELWGNGIAQDDEGNDLVGIRMQTAWDNIRGEFLTKRMFLQGWPETDDELFKAPTMSAALRAPHIEPIALHYLGAARDIAGEITARGSLWARLVSEPGLSDSQIEEIESQLDTINNQIIEGSPVLSHIQNNLSDLSSTVACDPSSVAITPLSRRLSDLRKGMDVVLAAGGGPQFPIDRQGMGTRSLSSILMMKAYMAWRQKNAPDSPIHPFVAIEEPETHLQPQAQRSLTNQIEQIPGQHILTTHSPFVASHVPIQSFRHFSKSGDGTVVRQLKLDSLEPEDLRKLNRRVVHSRGELLFGRGIVLSEGETEEQALPIFAEAFWGHPADSVSVTFVGVGSSSAYLPFLRLAKSFGIPWWVLGDGEPAAIADLDQALLEVGEADSTNNSQVHVLPNGANWEAYLASAGYEDILKDLVIDTHASTPQHRVALENQWKEEADVQAALASEFRRRKTMYGALAPRAIVSRASPEQRVPAELGALFAAISGTLDLHTHTPDQQ